MRAPQEVSRARQFFDKSGEEVFFAEATGRRVDVTDSLRVMGSGKTRQEARKNALRNWMAADKALRTKARLT